MEELSPAERALTALMSRIAYFDLLEFPILTAS